MELVRVERRGSIAVFAGAAGHADGRAVLASHNSTLDMDVIAAASRRASDVRGGPMFYADTLGIAAVLEGVRRFERALGPANWTPAPLLAKLGGANDTFQSWHRRREPVGGGA